MALKQGDGQVQQSEGHGRYSVRLPARRGLTGEPGDAARSAVGRAVVAPQLDGGMGRAAHRVVDRDAGFALSLGEVLAGGGPTCSIRVSAGKSIK